MVNNLPKTITGTNMTSNIVSIEPISPLKAHVFTRVLDNKIQNKEQRLNESYLEVETVDWNYWFYVSELEFAKALRHYKIEYKNGNSDTVFKVEKAQGDAHFKYFVQIQNKYIREFYQVNNHIVKCFNNLYDEDFTSLYEIDKDSKYKNHILMLKRLEQCYIDTGMTSFKDMTTDDVKVLALDLETQGLDNTRHQIFLNSINTNYGVKKLVYNDTDNEKQILEDSQDFIQEQDPDIITTFNGSFFDLPFIQVRHEYCGTKSRLGRSVDFLDDDYPETNFSPYATKLKVGGRTEDFYPCFAHGRHFVDTFHLVKRYNAIKRSMKSEGLKYSAQHFELYKDRPDYERTIIDGDKIYKTWLKDRDQVLKYAHDDTWETLEIYKILISSTFALAQIVPTSFQRLSHMGPSSIWDLLMIRAYVTPKYDAELDKMVRHSLPLSVAKTEKYKGGYVKCHLEGVIDDVHKADIASMYPNSMLKDGIKPDNDYLDQFQPMLKALTEQRLDAKYKMVKLKEFGDSDSYEYKNYEALQGALKVIINSSYGMLGSTIARFNSPTGAAKVTEEGRRIIQQVEKELVEGGCRLIETDSVTEDTPIFIRDKLTCNLDIISISSLHSLNMDNTCDLKRRYDGFKDYQILTRSGWKNINYTKKHKTDKQIIRLCSYNGYVKVTEDHSLFRYKKEIKPEDIHVGQYTFDQLYYNKFRLNGKTTNHISEDLAWVLGFMVAEGSASRVIRKNTVIEGRKTRYSTNISISNQNRKQLDFCTEVLKKELNINGKVYDCMKSSAVFKYVGGYNKIAYETIFNLIYDRETKEKKVPTVILNSPNNIIIKFLEGIWVGDGCEGSFADKEGYNHWRSCYDSKSFILIAGLQYLTDKIGKYQTNRISIRKDKPNIISMNMVIKRNMDDVIRYKENYEYDKEVYDVSTEDGTFIGGLGYTILHNTDGTMFTTDYKDIDVSKLISSISSNLPDMMDLDYEGQWDKMFSYKSKQYALVKDGKIKIKGSSLHSSSKSVFISDSLNKVMKMIFDEDFLNIKKFYTETVNKLMKRDFSTEDICINAKLNRSIERYYAEIKFDKEVKGTNKARAALYELLNEKQQETKKPHGFNQGDKVFYYKKGDKASEPYVVKNKFHAYKKCPCTNGKCGKCIDGKIYLYIRCPNKCDEGMKTVSKTITLKNVKDTKRSSKLSYLYLLYTSFINCDKEDITLDDLELTEDEKIEIVKKFKIDKMKNINYIKFIKIEHVESEDKNGKVIIKNKSHEITSTDEEYEDVLRFKNCDFDINDLIINVIIVGSGNTECRMCMKRDKVTKKIEPLVKAGYIPQEDNYYTLNCSLLENAPDVLDASKKPDYNIDHSIDSFRKNVADPFKSAFTSEMFDNIYSTDDLKEMKLETINQIHISDEEKKLLNKKTDDNKKSDENSLESIKQNT